MLADDIYSFNYKQVKPIDEVQVKKKIEGDSLANLFNETFSTPQGEKVLHYLVETFLTKPIARPNDDMLQIGIREGRADLVRQIIKTIQHSKGNNNGR